MRTMLSEFTDDQQALAAAMSDLSEAGYHAGWLCGLEYDLWRLMLRGGNRYGQHDVSEGELIRLRTLSQKCGGWIVSDEEREEVFVPMIEWGTFFAAHAERPSPPNNAAWRGGKKWPPQSRWVAMEMVSGGREWAGCLVGTVAACDYIPITNHIRP